MARLFLSGCSIREQDSFGVWSKKRTAVASLQNAWDKHTVTLFKVSPAVYGGMGFFGKASGQHTFVPATGISARPTAATPPSKSGRGRAKRFESSSKVMGIAAILLAAGQSRRMGAFKPLLPFGERTVLECCVNYLTAGGAESIVVVIGHRRPEMRAALAHLPVRIAVNADAGSGMSASIARGVELLDDETEAILIAPADLPAIPPEVPRTLIEAWRSSGARLVRPEHEGRGGHPVLLDGSLRPELLSLDPQRGLRALFDAHRSETLRVAVASPYIARDMDTWDDYRALYEEVMGSEPPGERSA